MALSLALLVGAAAMLESLWRLSRVDPGFVPARALTFRVNPPASQYLEYERSAALHRELREGLLALPGVTSVELVSQLPLTELSSYARDHVEVVGATDRDPLPPADLNLVSRGYFELMGIRLIRGEAFGELAVRSDAPPVVVSARLAELLFGPTDPVGQTMVIPGYRRFIDQPPFRVAGVVDDVAGETLMEPSPPMLYFPAVLEPGVDPEVTGAYPLVPREMTVVVRTSVDPLSLVGAARRVVRSLDSKLPVDDVRTLDDLVGGATARMRLAALLLIVAAAAAVGLGVTGVYGIVAYSVSRRTAEIGLRVALGATRAEVQRMLLGQTGRIATGGAAGGLAAVYGLTRALRSQLYEVSAGDPSAFGSATVVLVVVVLAAGRLPARRAGRLDAVAALRTD